MSLPTPQESASLLFETIKKHYFQPASHVTVSDLLIKIAAHIAADRAAHCRHVAVINERRDWLIKQLATCLSLFDSYPAFDDEMAALIEMTDEFKPNASGEGLLPQGESYE